MPPARFSSRNCGSGSLNSNTPRRGADMRARVHVPSTPVAALEGVRLLRRDEIDPGTDYVPPSTPLEGRLARIWEDILKIDKVGNLDDFFELGGDSLQAV